MPLASRKRLAALLAVLVIAAAGIGAWLALRPGMPSGNLVLYGNVDIREALPAFDASGRIAAMEVQEGTHVKTGELLARLDDTLYAASLRQAEADLAGRKATLDRLLAGSRPEEIAAAKADMDAAEITWRNDSRTWHRLARLVPKGAAMVQDRDNAEAASKAAQQQYQAAREKWILAVKGPRIEDIDAARAAWQAAEAAVALAQRHLADTRLYAPADGVIEDRILEPGDMVSPQSPVFTMALTSPLWVRAYLPETDLGKVRPGAPATISTDSYPGKTYRGWVGYIAATAEFTPKTVETPELRTALVYQIRVFACDPQGELRLGMPATVDIDVNAQPKPGPRPGCDSGNAGKP